MQWLYLLGCLWFFLPAGVANMSPIFANKLLGKGKPLDGGKSWRGVRIFGDNKTWQGLIAGTIFAGLFFLVQRQLAIFGIVTLPGADAASYRAVPLLLGFVLGFGAMLGDAIKSFFKRRIAHVPPGESWVPFDQIDWVLGGGLAIAPFIHWTLWYWLAVVVIFGITHPIINLIGWMLGLKKNKF